MNQIHPTAPAASRREDARLALHEGRTGECFSPRWEGPPYLRTRWWKPGAFTLLEILVVMGVIVVIISLVGPVITSLQGASNINRAVYDISGLLGQARAYAMSNRTYVYVGVEEVDIEQPSSATPKKTGVGQVAMAVIASKDGTSGYNFSDVPDSWVQPTTTGFFVIGKVQTFDNLHLVNLGQRPDTGTMARPPYSDDGPIDPKYNLGDTTCTSATQFNYPLGDASTATIYKFAKVIQFSPQGVARIQTTGNSDIVSPWLEIGLEQTHGNVAFVPQLPVTTGAVAALQINGVSGAVRIYRP